jgi:hypothetical protein
MKQETIENTKKLLRPIQAGMTTGSRKQTHGFADSGLENDEFPELS